MRRWLTAAALSLSLTLMAAAPTPDEAALLAHGKRIAALGPRGSVQVPKGARVVDAADGFSREEILAAIDALRQLAKKAPNIAEEKQ